MDMLTAQESVFAAAALRQAADRYTAAQLSAQPTSRSSPAQISHLALAHADTRKHVEISSMASCWKGMTITCLHPICSKKSLVCAQTHIRCPSVIYRVTAPTACLCYKKVKPAIMIIVKTYNSLQFSGTLLENSFSFLNSWRS